MVRIEENKIIIEISTPIPCEELDNINKALADCIIFMDEKLMIKDTIDSIILLIKELQPTFEQLKKNYGTTK